MKPPKLNRDQSHAINAQQADQLYLWDSPIHHDRQNLTLRDHGRNDVFTVYAITNDQLADWYVEIGRVLGKPSVPTIHHLKQIHEIIGTIIEDAEPHRQEAQRSDSFAYD